MSEIKVVGVLGCGLMGAGIAEVSARAGYETVVREVSAPLLQAGLKRIEGSIDKAVARGKLEPAEGQRVRERVRGTLDLADFQNADWVCEAIVEDPQAKKEIFAALDRVVKPAGIFATNTSSLSVTALAAVTGRPDRFLGLHFFNPVPVQKLVEIVRGISTSEATLNVARSFARSLGKEGIETRDSPGFVVNLLLIPYLLDAVRALQNGVATRDDIDRGMRLGCAHPMGPLELLDFVGLDTTLAIGEILFQEFRDPRYAAPPLLRRMVEAGHYGRKTGHGFYEYDANGKPKTGANA